MKTRTAWSGTPWEPGPRDPYSDISGWCRNDRHDECDGILRASTGWHWFCACPHHEPQPEPLIGSPDHKAWKVWAKARERAA
jgi:hypothetical protein